MSRFNGSDEELTIGEALVEMATRIAWQTEPMQNEVIKAIRKEFGIEVPEPDHRANVADARDITLMDQDAALKAQQAEMAVLRAKLERANLEKELAVSEAETRALRSAHPVSAADEDAAAELAGSVDPGDTAPPAEKAPAGKRVR